MSEPALLMHNASNEVHTIRKRKERSPLVVAAALVVGLVALGLGGGPVAGIVGAVLGATAGSVAVRIHDHNGG